MAGHEPPGGISSVNGGAGVGLGNETAGPKDHIVPAVLEYPTIPNKSLTETPSNTAPPPNRSAINEESRVTGPDDHTVVNKARLRERLQGRWRCKNPGHRYCYTGGYGINVHYQLTDGDLETWVSSTVAILYHYPRFKIS